MYYYAIQDVAQENISGDKYQSRKKEMFTMGVIGVFMMLIYPLVLPAFLITGDFENVERYFEMLPDMFKITGVTVQYGLPIIFESIF